MGIPENYNDFLDTLEADRPGLQWPDPLRALWFDATGDWTASHDIAQAMHNEMGSWLHAYLHRKEGDEFNAGYWYRQAKKPFPKTGLEAEHRAIVESVLKNQ